MSHADIARTQPEWEREGQQWGVGPRWPKLVVTGRRRCDTGCYGDGSLLCLAAVTPLGMPASQSLRIPYPHGDSVHCCLPLLRQCLCCLSTALPSIMLSQNLLAQHCNCLLPRLQWLCPA